MELLCQSIWDQRWKTTEDIWWLRDCWDIFHLGMDCAEISRNDAQNRQSCARNCEPWMVSPSSRSTDVWTISHRYFTNAWTVGRYFWFRCKRLSRSKRLGVESTPWVQDVLKEVGYAYSSRIILIKHDHYGIPRPSFPVRSYALWISNRTDICTNAGYLVENFFAKIKQYRAIAMCYDKRACNFLRAILLVAAVEWLKR